MVLEEASPTSSGSFTEDTPSSDADPYAPQPTSTATPAQRNSLYALRGPVTEQEIRQAKPALEYAQRLIAEKKISRPFYVPLLTPLFGYGPQRTFTLISSDIISSSRVVGRPLTEEEVTACAEYCGKHQHVESYRVPVGLGAGLYRAYATNTSMHMPFIDIFKEGSKLSKDKFWIWRDAQARLAWHVLRYNLYAAVGLLFATPLFSVYAASVAAIGQSRDPRMKNVTGEIKRQAMGRQAEAEQQAKGLPAGAQTVPQDGHGSQQQSMGPQTVPQNGYDNQQDMGPRTVPQNGYVNQQRYDTGLISDQQSLGRANGRTTEQASDSPNSFDFDDVSPTAGTSGGSSQGAASAWDRLRQGQGPTAPQQPGGWRNTPQQRGSPVSEGDAWARRRGPGQNGQQPQGGSASSGESFNFSQSEGDSNTAKDEAQRDFDARLERERKGQSFDESPRKWN